MSLPYYGQISELGAMNHQALAVSNFTKKCRGCSAMFEVSPYANALADDIDLCPDCKWLKRQLAEGTDS